MSSKVCLIPEGLQVRSAIALILILNNHTDFSSKFVLEEHVLLKFRNVQQKETDGRKKKDRK